MRHVLVLLCIGRVIRAHRGMTDECTRTSDSFHVVNKHEALGVVRKIKARKVDNVTNYILRNAFENASRANAYMEFIRGHRMRIPNALYRFLVEFSEDERVGRSSDAQVVWQQYKLEYPTTAVDCETMYVWYTVVFGLGIEPLSSSPEMTIGIPTDHEAVVALVDLVNFATDSRPSQSPFEEYIFSYERYIAAQFFRTGGAGVGSGLEAVASAIGRPTRFLTESVVAVIQTDPISEFRRIGLRDMPEFSRMRVLANVVNKVAPFFKTVDLFPTRSLADEFTLSLIAAILAGKFRLIAPTWSEIRAVLAPSFPELEQRSTAEYLKYRTRANAVARIISLPLPLFERIIRGEVPETLNRHETVWIKHVLVPTVGSTIGSMDLHTGLSHAFTAVIPPMHTVRRLLLDNFHYVQDVQPASISLLQRIPERERLIRVLHSPRHIIGQKRKHHHVCAGIDLLVQAVELQGASGGSEK